MGNSGPLCARRLAYRAMLFELVDPTSDELAIPSYDELAASQVVKRLPGLDAAELAAIGTYERAHRGRRTILTRIRQLQSTQ